MYSNKFQSYMMTGHCTSHVLKEDLAMHMFPNQFRALPNTSAILCCKCDSRADYIIINNGVDDYYCTPHKREESHHIPPLPLCSDCQRPSRFLLEVRVNEVFRKLCCSCRKHHPVDKGPRLAVTRYDSGEDDGYLD